MKMESENETDQSINELELDTRTQNTKQFKCNWTKHETMQLIKLYKTLRSEVGKRFPLQKDMWSEISSHITGKTPRQCAARIKTIYKRKRKGIEKIYITKKRRMSIDSETDNIVHIVKIHNMECDLTPIRNNQIWSNRETKQLIRLYESLIDEVGKRYRNKKAMWTEISKYFPGKTPFQCQTRLKTVLRRKKKGILNNYITKKVESTIDSEDEDAFNNVRINSAEIYEENVTTSIKNINMWSVSETKKLMELYKSLISEVGPAKIFNQKKEMWFEISKQIPNKNAKQCENRFKHLLNKKRKGYNAFSIETIRGNILDSERNPIDVKGNHCDESILQTNRVQRTEVDVNEMNVRKPNTPEKEEKSIQEVILEIAAKREKANERRHREKMEALNNMQNILQQILICSNY